MSAAGVPGGAGYPTPEAPEGSVSAGREPDAAAVIARLRRAGASVATAESLTGGLVVARLTSVPGASAVVRGGIVAYSADLKVQLLGVDPGLLERTGTVHPEVAGQMARGARAALGADYAVATTGEAGPDSASGQPVGTAWIAVCGPVGCACTQVDATGGREQVRAVVVNEALRCLAEMLQADPVPTPAPSGPAVVP